MTQGMKRRGKKQRVEQNPGLEVLSSADSAWYDGDISVEGPRVRVHFQGFLDSEDEFWDETILQSERKIRDNVRLLSDQLQDADCHKVSVGMIVCANYKTSDGTESKYFDAGVTAVEKRQHTFQRRGKVENCTCWFTVMWGDGPSKGRESTLGCPEISLINTTDVEKHSVVAEIIRCARAFSEEAGTLSEESLIVLEELSNDQTSECVTGTEQPNKGQTSENSQVMESTEEVHIPEHTAAMKEQDPVQMLECTAAMEKPDEIDLDQMPECAVIMDDPEEVQTTEGAAATEEPDQVQTSESAAVTEELEEVQTPQNAVVADEPEQVQSPAVDELNMDDFVRTTSENLSAAYEGLPPEMIASLRNSYIFAEFLRREGLELENILEIQMRQVESKANEQKLQSCR